MGIRISAVFFFAIMTAMVRLGHQNGISLIEAMFYRNVIAAPLIFAYITVGPGMPTLKTAHLGMHATRSAVGLLGMVFTYGAYILLPLAEATTIGFTTPIFATILSVIFLREFVGVHRWIAVLIGFCGVLLVTRPGSASIPPFGALVAVGSGLQSAIISIQLRHMGKTEFATTTVFYFALFSVLVTGAIMLICTALGGGWAGYGFHPHRGVALWSLIGLGVSGTLGQVALSSSLRYGAVSMLVVMDYSNLIWATVFGLLIFGELPAASTWSGAPLIIGSGLYIAWREHKRGVPARAMT